MQGDKLASGAAKATFGGPNIKFDEAQMKADLPVLTIKEFCEKYMITIREYDMLLQSSGDADNILLKQMHDQTEVIERLVKQDAKQDQDLKRECFIEPFVTFGVTGRVIVSRDQPALRAEQSKLALPRHLRKEREMLPTTGHIVRARMFNTNGDEVSANFIGLRVIFGPMSGTALCFRGYPTWIMLDVAEILGIVHKEDAETVETPLEPLT